MFNVGKWLSHLLPLVIPIAAKWVEREERRILMNGVPLNQGGLQDAARMGVENPEKIRLMKVNQIPLLESHFMRILSRAFPAILCNPTGVSLGYGIYIHSRYWGNRHLIAHECVHSGQYERYGSRERFLHAYFGECLIYGYPDAPLEQEAILRSADLDGPE